MLEGRLAAKNKKAKALKATNAKYGWTYGIVIGVLMAMLLIDLQK